MVFIRMNSISKTFHGVKALNNVTLDLNYGEALCLAGQNGCGKSTLIKILSGVYQPDDGAQIKIGASQYNELTPEQSISKGIQVIYQDLALFPNLTVSENITINAYRKLGFINRHKLKEEAKLAIKSINANLDLDAVVETLPIAQQQLVAICRALAQNAKLLIMDEPTASLTAKEVKDLLNVVIKLKNKGISIIFVSHKLAEVMKVSDNILVLKDGNIVGKYPITEVDEKKLGFLMTGLEITPKKLAEINFSNQPTVLEVKNLSLTSQYKNINFSLKKGEIIALTGLLGSGRTELCLSLFGITQPTTGEILINGKKIKLKNNRHAIKNGIAYVSEDRLNTGLIMEESIHNNIISTIFDKISNKINLINQTRAYQKSNQLIQSLKIKLSNSDLPVNTLSGGNAQRVSIAKWLATSPQIIILDSPTIGVDIANKEEIFNIIRAMITQGISVIFITDEVEEAYYNSHRILIMKKGEITHELYSAKCSEKDIEEAIYESN
ncbi:TPA: sugar ABC transporter ATP-binding protein [Pasteurella multocida]|uniref:sugar ABC transporter ATP-binding protein n=1 Tax=Pasteurella multocida TaxID=747 RepID=UPI0010934531|nr:sugar ABC transporter ATP-binding protein [Pasteurella multocida]QCA30936.1 sugar ABC transporter ATP-binding protein [Pasteurella multocida]QXG50966.1 sugar ABC transporter ATP-binding protein [Pasteurella multocida]WGE14997.1 sugar ABC transporter ATP-binding protein [Pasteurella multocida]HDX0971392.1 sugar ABC transporter ATP-binding protein [Pasteurella multocida]HDX0971968.1 sugar ABC transporter ATP-binding protein [Pasteurella multocida]